MRDADIRAELVAGLRRQFPGDLIRTELGLCLGETRVDVAVVNGHLYGFEIKSAQDSLARLDRQIDVYSQVLDYATVVTSARHIAPIAARLPEWWGLTEAIAGEAGVCLVPRRAGTANPEPSAYAIAQLLWRDEAAVALAARGELVGRRETRWDLWDRLAVLPIDQLRDLVREQLKLRPHWPGGQ